MSSPFFIRFGNVVGGRFLRALSESCNTYIVQESIWNISFGTFHWEHSINEYTCWEHQGYLFRKTTAGNISQGSTMFPMEQECSKISRCSIRKMRRFSPLHTPVMVVQPRCLVVEQQKTNSSAFSSMASSAGCAMDSSGCEASAPGWATSCCCCCCCSCCCCCCCCC